jgi:thiol-disulfide isomerase/thioredoxin
VKDIGIWVAIALVGIAVLSGVLSGGAGSGPEIAPEFTLPNLDGIDVSLAEYRGSIVILDFWATWCKPCTKTFPELHALQEEYADRDVVLLVVSLDKSAQRARDHLIENGYATDNILWGSLEEARAVKELYGVGGIPRTFLIDRAGYIRYSGYPTRLTREEIEPWL